MSGRSAQDIVMERCLALLTRLLRGAAQPNELRDIIRTFADQMDNPTEKSIDRQFDEDVKRLRTWFACELNYDRKTNVWRIESIQNPPFDLPEDAIRGLAFLQATFKEHATPMSSEIQALFNAIIQMTPEERRDELRKQRGLIEIDVGQRDNDIISENVKAQISRACMEQRTIEFDYRANRPDAITVLHHAEPYRYFFEGGHYYLEAYCIETRSVNGKFDFGEMRRYRMGQISNVRILPSKFVRREHWRTMELIYELAPDVARLGVTKHIPESEIEMRSDGSAIVRAQTKMLFFDLRKLLHYGANCRVIGGEEALREMKKIVQGMAAHYNDI